MLRLMARLRRRDIVYSCGVGDQDPAGLPEILMQLGQGAEHGITLLFHDYLPISPAYTLLGADGVWRGLPAIGDPDPAHRICRPDGSTCDLAQWRRAWGALLARADTVTVFSDPSRALVAAAYPQIATRIALCPHVAVPVVAAQSRPGRDRRPVIGVLGNIGAHKGAAIVAALGQALAQDRRADLVLIGNLDPGFTLSAPSRVHGSYDPADLPALTARYDISCWLIPSVWPETFSYVTHEALATGLPVWCFDLGAQAAAVRTAVARGAAGGVIALQGDGPVPQLILARMLAPNATPAAARRAAAA
jgi:glycosyltransferase involved in cell wall biosynthesis